MPPKKASNSNFREKIAMANENAIANFTKHKPTDLADASINDPIFQYSEYNKQYLSNPKHPYWTHRTDYDPKFENPYYAAYYANKHGGKAYRGDFNDDGVDDIVIASKSGKISHVNGHSQHLSNRGRDLYYYDSEEYLKGPFKTEKGRFDPLMKSAKKVWIDSFEDVKKAEANKVLQAAGMNTFKIKDKTVYDALKNNAELVYDVVIKQLQQAHPEVKNLKSKLSTASFGTRITNAILLALGGLLNQNISNVDLPFYLKKLKTTFNKKENQQKVLDLSNEILGSLLEIVKEDSALAEAIYKVSAKEPDFNTYKIIASILLKAKQVVQDPTYANAVRKKNGALLQRPTGRTGVKPGTKLTAEEKAQRENAKKEAKRAKLMKQLEALNQ